MSRGKTIDSDHFNRRLPTYNYKTAVQKKKSKKKLKKSLSRGAKGIQQSFQPEQFPVEQDISGYVNTT
jgi:hypothetical protein